MSEQFEDLETLLEMGYEENDATLIPEIQDALEEFEETFEHIRIKTLLSGEYDGEHAIVSLHAGAGGTESCDWNSMLFRMYKRWAEDKGFTVDLASLDLYTGMCEFYKIGASATFIKRGEEVECISSASLPAGIFHQIEIEQSRRQLQDGDFVVLLSDGVLDYLKVPVPEETMREILETLEGNNPGQMAKQILEQILLFTAGKVPDDMTVLVTGIWKK